LIAGTGATVVQNAGNVHVESIESVVECQGRASSPASASQQHHVSADGKRSAVSLCKLQVKQYFESLIF